VARSQRAVVLAAALLLAAACDRQDETPLGPGAAADRDPPALSQAPVSLAEKQRHAGDLGPAGASLRALAAPLGLTSSLVTANAVPFAPKPGPFAHSMPACDDCTLQGLPIGFSFRFFNQTYTSFAISSNGFIGFTLGIANGCCSGGRIPSADGVDNIIAAAWTDLYPPGGGGIFYETRGQAPNRYLIVAFQDLPWFSEVGTSRVTSQIVLYEGSNAIEIHTTHQSAGHIYTQGAESADGFVAALAPGRSAANYALTDDAVRFTTVANFWTSRANMPAARQRPAVTSVGGSLYAIGGQTAAGAVLSSVTAYTPGPNTWTSKAALPSARVGSGAAAISGTIYVAGGNDASGTLTRTLYAYNPGTNRWTTRATLPVASGCGGSAAIGSQLFVFTGCTLLSTGAQVGSGLLHRYNPATNTWTGLPQAPTVHVLPAVAAIGGKLYVAGGNNGSGVAISQLDVYDPATNAWSTLPAMPTPRVTAAGVAIGGRFFVIGGRSGETYLSTVEAYDPLTNAWGTGPPMPTARSGLGVAFIFSDGRAYAVGGRNTTAALANNQRYTP
jgi:N-acetylneuraminic acid mutarotase